MDFTASAVGVKVHGERVYSKLELVRAYWGQDLLDNETECVWVVCEDQSGEKIPFPLVVLEMAHYVITDRNDREQKKAKREGIDYTVSYDDEIELRALNNLISKAKNAAHVDSYNELRKAALAADPRGPDL